jgi:hypothetical protein
VNNNLGDKYRWHKNKYRLGKARTYTIKDVHARKHLNTKLTVYIMKY